MIRKRIFSLTAAITLLACGKAEQPHGAAGGMPPAEVSVAQVVSRTVTSWDEFNGRIEAVETVEVRPRIGGYLERVHFEDGALVKRGELLFTIDAREYEAAFGSARANVARAHTRRELAQDEMRRAEKLAAVKAISQEELASRRAELRQAEADVQSAQAAQEQARLNVEFTRITAPIDGRASMAMIRPGNLVNGMMSGASLLTTIVSLDPVYVSFEGDEQVYLRYQALARAGARPSSRETRNPVRVGLANEQGHPHEGEMVFVDNQLNPNTGTIRARAELKNPDGIFTPGLFARVQLIGENSENTLLIHDQALLTDQDRRYVYVLGEGGVAARRDVQLGASVDGLRIVKGGLKSDDKVVVNGVRKIFFEGQALKPFEVPMEEPNRMPPPEAAPPVAADGAAASGA
jgi:multidrug efflux system membrane fusion protein